MSDYTAARLVQQAQRIAELAFEYDKLREAAQAVVEDNNFCNDKKPSPTDCYGINGVLLWKLRKSLEQEDNSKCN